MIYDLSPGNPKKTEWSSLQITVTLNTILSSYQSSRISDGTLLT